MAALLQNFYRKRKIHGGFKRIAIQFAIALRSMSIAEIKQSAAMKHGQVNRGAACIEKKIHIATIGTACSRANSFTAFWRHAHATKKRMQRDRQLLQFRLEIQRPACFIFKVELPPG